MSDLLTIDYSMLSPSLSKLELNTLREYQNLAINLMVLKDNLDKLNNDIDLNTIDHNPNLLNRFRELEKILGIIGTLFQGSVYKVLVNVNPDYMVKNSENNDSIDNGEENDNDNNNGNHEVDDDLLQI